MFNGDVVVSGVHARSASAPQSLHAHRSMQVQTNGKNQSGKYIDWDKHEKTWVTNGQYLAQACLPTTSTLTLKKLLNLSLGSASLSVAKVLS